MKTLSRSSLSLGLSILFHGCIYSLLFFVPHINAPDRFSKELTVDIINTLKDVPKDIQQQKESEKKKQIVEQDKNEFDEDAPQNAQFLSQSNRNVLKQTASQNSGEFQNLKTQKKISSKKGKPVASSKPQKQKNTDDKIIDFNPKVDWSEKAKEFYDHTQENITSQNLEASLGSQSRDYLKDIEKGNETLLSTREFVYYSYYVRIRNQISQYWEPSIKEKIVKLFKQGRNIAATGDKITKVLIVLDQNGTLMKVQILNASGIQDLDDAAVEAFKAAAPFPNPPVGITDKDGTIKIRWDFVLEA